MPIVYHDREFAAPIGRHIMPMAKFQLVADAVRAMGGFDIESPPPAAVSQILRVHTPRYVEAVRTGEPRVLAESQKFPWSRELFPSVCFTNGGCVMAAQRALREGMSAAIASGFHHAHRDHGEGFCTFNGLVVAAEALRAADPGIRVAVLDLDLHYGNGTASLAETRPWLLALSIYGNDYSANQAYRDVENVRHRDGENHRSRALVKGAGREDLGTLLDWACLEIADFRPALLLYQAGADPYKEDPYSPLDLDANDLFERDLRVFEFCKSAGLPVAWVLAGGYTPDIGKVVEIHANTFRAWRRVFAT